ncbi:Uncharacterized OsmC-related protein [Flexibacter flexilis DSM 6793]|uniref:Uncharacterized OsmC-related protein n=1 Tax=Flexibacter flexilis DSM 6793 TaxID=927664 RepID=A0A1I1JLZ1_9BACT|nr:OsmC family protein [Flexibacter flexilis]SFC49564.1 Uncharacterized OsmC-related protein [Flexibacter flexilis DSM 6793]
MPTIHAKYLGGLRTEAKHLQSGNVIITDAPTDNNGKGEAFSPTDLVCAALANCMMTLMGIAANRDNIALEGTEYEITKFMQADPRKIAKIEIIFRFPALNLTERQQTILRNTAKTCPVALTLSEDVIVDTKFLF